MKCSKIMVYMEDDFYTLAYSLSISILQMEMVRVSLLHPHLCSDSSLKAEQGGACFESQQYRVLGADHTFIISTIFRDFKTPPPHPPTNNPHFPILIPNPLETGHVAANLRP